MVLMLCFTSLGYYCTSGVDRPQPGAPNDTAVTGCSCPQNTYFTGVGGICPLGHYCPTGSDRPLGCSPGSYADEEGLALCKLCPAGYYCMINATDFVTSECPEGKK